MNDKRLTSLQLNVPNQIDLLKTDKTDKFTIIHKFGSNMEIGTAVEDIQTNGGFYQWAISPFKVEVVSTDPDDTFLGIGGRSITVQGLEKIGSNLFDVQETIPLNGLTPVVGNVDFFRTNRMFLETSGVYASGGSLSHQGNINIQVEGGGEIQGQLLIDTLISTGASQIARFSTPSNARGYLQGFVASTASNKAAKYFIFMRPDSNIVTAPFSTKRLIFAAPPFVGSNGIAPENPLEFEPNTDVWFCGVGLQGADNELTVDFELTLKFFDLP